MFDGIVAEIFAEAGVGRLGNEALWQQAIEILSAKMAFLSATMGLTWERVERFNEQKAALVADLRRLKQQGLTV